MTEVNFKGKLSRGAAVIVEGQVLAPPSCAFVGKTFAGAFSYFGDACVIGSSRIGRFCSFASSIKVGLGEHPVDRLSSHPIFYGAKMDLTYQMVSGLPEK